jgi:hypothetical protein
MDAPSRTERAVLREALDSHRDGMSLIALQHPSLVLLETLKAKGWLKRHTDEDGDELYTLTIEGVVAATGPAAPSN